MVYWKVKTCVIEWYWKINVLPDSFQTNPFYMYLLQKELISFSECISKLISACFCCLTIKKRNFCQLRILKEVHIIVETLTKCLFNWKKYVVSNSSVSQKIMPKVVSKGNNKYGGHCDGGFSELTGGCVYHPKRMYKKCTRVESLHWSFPVTLSVMIVAKKEKRTRTPSNRMPIVRVS